MKMTLLGGAATLCALLIFSPAYAWDGTNTGSGQLVEQGTANQNSAMARANSNSAASVRGVRGGNASVTIVNQAASPAAANPSTNTPAASPNAASPNAKSSSGNGTSGNGHTAHTVVVDPNGNGNSNGYGGNGRIPVASAIPAPIVNGGCNTGGFSGVIQSPIIGGGATLGGKQDIVCQSNEIGRADVAFVYLCFKDEDYAKASRYTRQPCPDKDARPTPIPAVVITPAPTPSPEPVPHNTKIIYRPDYCGTRNAGDRNQHRECDRDQEKVVSR